MNRALLIVGLLIACWLWMQIVHEAGHVLGAVVSGGRVERVVLHPLAISRTEVSGGQSPLVVIWAGPLVGSLLPVLVWLVAARLKLISAYLLRFFAGFCLIVNGAYLFGGSFDGIGDCGDLLRHGAPIWTLWLFGLIAIPAGLLLWHGQGRDFGLGPEANTISPAVVHVVLAIALVTIAVELAAGALLQWQ